MQVSKKIDTQRLIAGVRTLHLRKVNGRFGASHFGNIISSVLIDGPAHKAGLKKGDLLISINGISVERLSEWEITKLSEDVDDDVTLVVRYDPSDTMRGCEDEERDTMFGVCFRVKD